MSDDELADLDAQLGDAVEQAENEDLADRAASLYGQRAMLIDQGRAMIEAGQSAPEGLLTGEPKQAELMRQWIADSDQQLVHGLLEFQDPCLTHLAELIAGQTRDLQELPHG
jgi:hypothetical protein